MKKGALFIIVFLYIAALFVGCGGGGADGGLGVESSGSYFVSETNSSIRVVAKLYKNELYTPGLATAATTLQTAGNTAVSDISTMKRKHYLSLFNLNVPNCYIEMVSGLPTEKVEITDAPLVLELSVVFYDYCVPTYIELGAVETIEILTPSGVKYTQNESFTKSIYSRYPHFIPPQSSSQLSQQNLDLTQVITYTSISYDKQSVPIGFQLLEKNGTPVANKSVLLINKTQIYGARVDNSPLLTDQNGYATFNVSFDENNGTSAIEHKFYASAGGKSIEFSITQSGKNAERSEYISVMDSVNFTVALEGGVLHVPIRVTQNRLVQEAANSQMLSIPKASVSWYISSSGILVGDQSGTFITSSDGVYILDLNVSASATPRNFKLYLYNKSNSLTLEFFQR